MTVELNPQQEEIVRQEIRNGHFRSVDELLDHVLKSLQSQEPSKASVKPRPNLADFLSQSPFAYREDAPQLDLDRRQDFPRRVDL